MAFTASTTDIQCNNEKTDKTASAGDQESTMETCVHKLNSDVIIMIFEYLDISARQKAALTCKKWKDLVYLPQFWRSCTPRMKVEQFNLAVATSLSQRQIESVSLNMAKESLFNINICDSVNKSKVDTLILHDVFLECFGSNPCLDGRLQHVQKLVAHQSKEDSPDEYHLWLGLSNLLDSFFNLKQLYLRIDTNTHIEPQHVSLYDGKRPYKQMDISIATEAVADSAPNLIDLDIKPLPLRMLDSTDSAVTSLSNLKPLKELKRISIGDTRKRVEFQFTYWVDRYTSHEGTGLDKISSMFPNLNHLEILDDRCYNMKFPSHAGCEQLQSLTIAIHAIQSNLDDESLTLFLNRCPVLKALDIRGAGTYLSQLARILDSCPQLELLDISFVRFFGDKFQSVLDVIADKLPLLKVLLMVGCQFVDDSLIDHKVHINNNFLPKFMQMESIQGIENCDMDIAYFADVPLKYIGLGRSHYRLRGNEHGLTKVDHQTYVKNVEGHWSLVEDENSDEWNKAWGFNYFQL